MNDGLLVPVWLVRILSYAIRTYERAGNLSRHD
jgi:hypothetical protein